MSEVRGDYIPLDQAASEKLRVALPIPSFVDKERILVGLKPIHRLFWLAGINHLRVQPLESDETSNFQPTVVGFDSSGSAYAAKTGLKTVVPTYSVDTENNNNRFFMIRQVNGTIDVNIDEIAKRITKERRWSQGLRSPEPWAFHLNRALKGSIRSIGLKHLLFNFDRTDLFVISFVQGSTIALNAGKTLEDLIGSMIGQNLFMNIANTIIHWRNQVRPSLMYGPQLDRAAIFAAYLATRPLVKVVQK